VYRVAGGGALVRVAALPVPVASPALARVGPRIYAIGGRLAGGRPSSLVEEYDIATEKSVIAAKLPEPVSEAPAVTIDGYVYLIGGLRGAAPSKEIVRFDPWADRAAVVGRLPLRTSGGEGATARLRRAYVIGASAPAAGRVNLVISLSRRNF
jgi:Kelch motif